MAAVKNLSSDVRNLREPIKVSVAIIAYNVANYIEEAIESVLTQNVDFPVELVIGEDCSTDNTLEIALKYQELYPNIIRVLVPLKNQGLTPNGISTVDACRGEYIALLDSDDYWTDKDKLAYQIKILEENMNFAASSHQSIKIFDDEPTIRVPFGATIDGVYTVRDMITHRKFHTSSFVFRRCHWVSSGGIPSTISSNERALFPMIAIYGNIHYSSKSMCVYRFTGFGLSSRIEFRELESDLHMLPWLKLLAPEFPVHKFRSFLHRCIYTYGTKKIPFHYLLKHYLLFTFYSFSYFPGNFRDLRWGAIEFYKRGRLNNKR